MKVRKVGVSGAVVSTALPAVKVMGLPELVTVYVAPAVSGCCSRIVKLWLVVGSTSKGTTPPSDPVI
ncbi:MAG TPA: hypothetical protein VGE37_08555 [Archangium sp.]